MSELDPRKLHVVFHKGTSAQQLSLPRRYTLTHSDRTGELFLTIGENYNKKQIASLHTRLMRDEVLAELKQERQDFTLHIYCHVSGGLAIGTAGWRNNILHRHMRLVIEALHYGDRKLASGHPEFGKARVLVHFQSDDDRYNRVEDWGSLYAYG